MDRTQEAALFDEMMKIAARAGLKHIRRLVESGTPAAIEQANRIAKSKALTMGRKSQAGMQNFGGSQVRYLGHGAEGLSHLTADPELGLVARKIYDPRGSTKKRMIGRKAYLSKNLGPEDVDEQSIAKVLRSQKTPYGANVTYSEYSPPGKPYKPRQSDETLSAMVSSHLEKNDPALFNRFAKDIPVPGSAIDFQLSGVTRRQLPPDFVTRLKLNPKIRAQLEQEMVMSGSSEHMRNTFRKRHGVELGDIRSPNWSGNKVVDFNVFRPGEYFGQGGLFREFQELNIPKTRKLLRHNDELISQGRARKVSTSPSGESEIERIKPSQDMYFRLMRGGPAKPPLMQVPQRIQRRYKGLSPKASAPQMPEVPEMPPSIKNMNSVQLGL